MLNHIPLIQIQLQGIHNPLVALHDFGSRKAHRDFRLGGMVLNQVHDAVQAAVQCAPPALRIAEVHAPRRFLIMSHMECMLHQLLNALSPDSGNRHHGNPQDGLHGVNIHGAAVFRQLVHHVQCQHHGPVQLNQLQGQVQIALNIGGIHDIDNACRLLPQDKLPGHNLLLGVGGHGINPRQIRNLRQLVAPDAAAFLIHRHPREIAHMLVGAGQLVKKRSLAAVLIPCQGKGQHLVIRQGIFPLLHMIFATFTKSRMVASRLVSPWLFRLLLLRLYLLNSYLLRIIHPECQLVVMDAELNRVPQRGKLHQRNPGTRHHAHIKKMLAEGSLAPHGQNPSPLPGLQFI